MPTTGAARVLPFTLSHDRTSPTANCNKGGDKNKSLLSPLQVATYRPSQTYLFDDTHAHPYQDFVINVFLGAIALLRIDL